MFCFLIFVWLDVMMAVFVPEMPFSSFG